ncbi:MAG: PKD domain-containing protein [Thermoplasmatales archaeon]|nr:MAG: PKD domain-containing protein [Thermoplasmatales archaeon]
MNKNDLWKKVLVFGILFVFIGLGIAPASSILKIAEKTSNSNIPTWYKGDEWIYTANPVFYSGENGSFSGKIENLKNKVLNITNIMHDGKQYFVYEVEITGDISGDFSFNGLSGDLVGEIIGTTFIRISDLAEIKTEILSEGTIKILFVDLDYEANSYTNFFPPIELYDFPLNVGEKWDISCESISSGAFSLEGLINESFSGSQWIIGTMYCERKEDVNVPAGVFECYKLNRTDNTVWYSPDVGNSVKSIVDMSDKNTTFFATLSLESFSRSTQPVTITFHIDPPEVVPGENVTIFGQAINTESGYPMGGAPILIEIPSAGYSWSGATNTDGQFVVMFEVPYVTDDTPSPNEIGSVGVIVQCLSHPLHGIKVKTLVIIENTAPDSPTIDGTTNGKAGTEYEYTFKAVDPDDDEIYYWIEWGDGFIEEWVGPYASGEERTITHTWSKKGNYTIRCKAMDVYGKESAWGELEVVMPMNLHSTNSLFFQFLEKVLQRFLLFDWIISSFPALNRILIFY